MGRTLQRKMGVEEQAVVLMPLLEGLDGVNKMSKSLGNYIGITEQPKDIFGKMMSINDTLMLRYYELLSHISVEELNSLKKGIENGTVHPKKAKENLALEIVERYWSKDASLKAKEEFEHIFGKQKGLPDDIPEYSTIENWLPKIIKDVSPAGSTSTSAAIRLIKQGGVKINDSVITDPETRTPKGEHILKIGKRKFFKLIVK
ncbi:MAG: tyrosine--tRNA ligase, partial [Nitrospirota bacterium]|nr:tyrosine--tRNA ligase [Nitrospirota bacterium]